MAFMSVDSICASSPDTLSVLAMKQYALSSLEEYYRIVPDSTLSEIQRDLHESKLVYQIFYKEDVEYNHSHLSALMRLNALSDSIQKRAESEFAILAEDGVSYRYSQEYLITPSFIHSDLTIYQVCRTSYWGGANPDHEVTFFYMDKRSHTEIDQVKLFKEDRGGLNELIQKYLLLYVNSSRADSADDIALLKYLGYWCLDELDEVAVYDFNEKEMLCLFNPYAIHASSGDIIVLRIPLREVKSFLSKEFLKILR